MSKIEQILSQLDKCREVPGQDSARAWSACCPAHDDKTPSFGIAETNDGKILMHCWSGCSVEEICFALGVEMQDLFPEDSNWRRQEYDPSLDELTLKIAKSDRAKGKAPSQVDQDAEAAAFMRIKGKLPSPRVDRSGVMRGAAAFGKRESEKLLRDHPWLKDKTLRSREIRRVQGQTTREWLEDCFGEATSET